MCLSLGIKDTLNKGQEEGLKIVTRRIFLGEKYSVIAGYAGTGKTFLVNAIVDKLGYNELEVVNATFTGKAALRLQEFGHRNSFTLHKLLYDTKKTGKGFVHIPKTKDSFDGLKLIVVDEVSMVPDYMVQTLANTGIHIIFLGDPFQLPPIGRDNGLLAHPHVLLTEIMRRGDMNTITEFTERLRLGKRLPVISDDFIRVHEKSEVTSSMLNWADQVICGKNMTRHSTNELIRQSKGFVSPIPEKDEKIICTRNNWNLFGEKGYPLVNGMIGYLRDDMSSPQDHKFLNSLGGDVMYSTVTFSPDFDKSEIFNDIRVDAKPFVYELANGKPIFSTEPKSGYPKGMELNTIEYGYAITTHKAQGSEYKKVLGLEEVLKKKQHPRWLYTLATRSSDKLVIVRDKNSGIWE